MESIDDDEDIFTLGADSIDVPSVVVVIEKECGVQLRPDDLNVSPTVSEIADAVARIRNEE